MENLTPSTSQYTPSRAYLATLPGRTYLAHGTPRTAGGGIGDGFVVGADSSTVYRIAQYGSAGTELTRVPCAYDSAAAGGTGSTDLGGGRLRVGRSTDTTTTLVLQGTTPRQFDNSSGDLLANPGLFSAQTIRAYGGALEIVSQGARPAVLTTFGTGAWLDDSTGVGERLKWYGGTFDADLWHRGNAEALTEAIFYSVAACCE